MSAAQSKRGLNLLDLNLDFGVEPRSLPGKTPCRKCSKRIHVVCPDCLVVSGVEDPDKARARSKLPLKVHVWRSNAESRHAKSTSCHIPALLQDGDAEIVPLEDLPSYKEDPGGVLILFPSATSKRVTELPSLEKYHTLCVIDVTWNKTGGVIQRLEKEMKEGGPAASFVHVHIAAYETLFWRHQQLGSHCLSTVESVYFFLREFLVEKARREQKRNKPAAGVLEASSSASPSAVIEKAASDAASDAVDEDPCDAKRAGYYDGCIDNLVLLFVEQYHRIQDEYAKHADRKFTHKHRPGYIKSRDEGNSAAPAEGAGADEMGADGAAGEDALASSSSSSIGAQLPKKRARPDSIGDSASAPKQSWQQRRPPKGASCVRVDLLDEYAAAKLRRQGDGAAVAPVAFGPDVAIASSVTSNVDDRKESELLSDDR